MSQKYGKILVVDDKEDILFALKLLLKKHVEKIDTEQKSGQYSGTSEKMNPMIWFFLI